MQRARTDCQSQGARHTGVDRRNFHIRSAALGIRRDRQIIVGRVVCNSHGDSRSTEI